MSDDRAPEDVPTSPDWPDPIDFLSETTGAPELRAEHVPDALWPFIWDTSRRMGVDPAMVALSALVSCASAIHEGWAIQPKARDWSWTERARIWGAIVADPSQMKTPVIGACTRPLDRLEEEARRRHTDGMRDYKRRHAEWKDARGPVEEEPRPPRLERYLVEGTTVEALAEVLRDDYDAKQVAPLGRVLVRQDELSEWVASFDRYRGGKAGGDRQSWLRLFNGGRHSVDRVARGHFAIPHWSACILGGIQPEPIQRIANDSADDGLLQRFCFCVPAAQREGEDKAPDLQAIERYRALFPALVALHPPREDDPLQSAIARLSDDAQAQRQELERLRQAVAAMPDTSPRVRTSLDKWRGLFPRFVLLFHLVEVADANARGATPPPLSVVQPETAARAAAYMRDILLPHLIRADALMFASQRTGHAKWIAGHIIAHGKDRITRRDIQQAYGALRGLESQAELNRVMDTLAPVGWVRPAPRSNPELPIAAWEVNPAVHVRFAARAAQERQRREEARAEVSALIRAAMPDRAPDVANVAMRA